MPARCIVISAWAVAFLFSLPVRATAQKSVFVDAFIEFHSALYGTYGNEGPRVTAALDRMAASLDVWEQANRDAERSLKALTGTTPADLALLYADQQRLDDAAAAIRAAIADDPRPAYRVFEGLLDQATGHLADANRAFAAARGLDPMDPIAAYLAAAAMPDDPDRTDLSPLLALLKAATDRGGTAVSRPFATFALIDDRWSKTPMFALPLYADGFEAIVAGHLRDALQRFHAAASRDPLVTDPAGQSPHLRAGVRALQEKKGGEAIRELEAAVMALPESSEAHRVLGIAYRATNQLPAAIAQFESAVRLAPGVARARIALGTTLMEAGRLPEAERVLREAIEALPASGDARWALADLYERLDRGIDAAAVLDSATSLTVIAGKAQLYWRIAQLAHLYRRDYSRVIQVLSRRTWLLLDDANTHKDLGMAYYRARREQPALVELTMARLLGHEDGEMLSAIGELHLGAGRLAEAEASLRRAVAMAPELAQAHYALGMTLRRLHRFDEATTQLETFKRLQAASFDEQRRGFDLDVAVRQARGLASAGRLSDAAAAYETATALGAPAAIYRELAAIYAKLGRDADRARALAAAGQQ